jgi:hypothetical protein
MSMKNAERLNISISIFDLPTQRALVLPHLLPREFIREILEEFGLELAFLGDDRGAYQLALADDGQVLDDERTMAQVGPNAQLVLIERALAIPEHTRPIFGAAYLRGRVRGQRVFRIAWQPSIIGRADPTRADNIPVAVDLSDYPTGLRVSRRHAQITEDKGQFFIASLSQNPTEIVNNIGDRRYVTSRPQQLVHGDTVVLISSGISLEFIIRPATN